LVRRKRRPDLKARVDSSQIVNDALKSFLSGVRQHEFPNLQHPENVRQLLSSLVGRLLIDQQRQALRGKRSPEREVASADGRPMHLADAAQATPADLAAAAEFLEKLWDRLRDVHPKAMELLEFWLEGLPTSEVAARLGLGVRSVQLILKDMEQAARSLAAEDDRHGDDRPVPPAVG
jgi:DNA-directed RNA polymerase specialized sigma24 family protein